MNIARATSWEGSAANAEREDGTPGSTLRNAVSEPERRYLLQYLLLNRYMVTRADAAEEVAARTQDTGREAVSDDDRTRAEIRLEHDHLPRLEAAGILEYDRASTMVALRPDAESAVRAAL
ncbi:DUF7344 domain-containing protein [Halostella salina]|uniref:DUF7344 domain-containing protein n=1 Tax=Halostella salina TaxID=1547897 RepID=UPI0013CF03D4|nr:hypothetical protein [Halostella salina]